LAAILFPVFAQAREKARQTSCLSNEKQIGLGILMYVGDYDETYPNAGYDGCSTNANWGLACRNVDWWQVIQPYIKSWNLCVCPDDNDTQVTAPAYIPADPSGTADPTSQHKFAYLYNDMLAGANYSNGALTRSPASLATVAAPATNIVLFEGVMFGGFPYIAENVGCLITGVEDPTDPGNWTSGTCAAYGPTVWSHNDGMNSCHSDGHVKWYRVRGRNSDGSIKSILNSTLPWPTYVSPDQSPTGDGKHPNGLWY
jgi:type II secretory pathway pseudopilin PulG